MAPAKTADSGRKPVPPKKIIDTIREATGASDEDISAMLAECNYDVNEATARLIDSELHEKWALPHLASIFHCGL